MAEPDAKTEPSIRDLIIEKKEQAARGDLYALLGIQRGADGTAIRNAYFGLAKIVHPDAMARQGLKDIERMATEVYKAVTDAYQILSDRGKRLEYEARLDDPRKAPKVEKQRDTASEARILFHKGSLMLQRRALAEAETCFRKALELDPQNPSYLTLLGWSVMQSTELPEGVRLEEARKLFEKALENASGGADPYYYMSLYYKAKGQVDLQRRFLQDTLTTNPRHVDAMREMRLLTMRQAKKNTSFFGSLLQALSGGGSKPAKKKR